MMVKKNSSRKFFPIVALLIMVLASMGCNMTGGQSKDTSSEAEITVDEATAGEPVFEYKEHDFGEITYGEEVGARFGFENQGKGPLVIERVSTGCGCTVAEYTKKPVAPGEGGFVEVIFFFCGKSGAQIQNARVYFKGVKKPVRLSVVAQVVRK